MKKAVIFTNGNLSDTQKAGRFIKKNAFVVCADGGVEYAIKAKIDPNLVIGDMDSLPKKIANKLKKNGVEFIEYPKEKDWTDFELAVDYCLEKGFKDFLIVGFLGDRLDHLFASLFFLAKKFMENNDMIIKIIEGDQEIYFVRKSLQLKGKRNSRLSLIPIAGDAKKITSKGLYYPLNNESLPFGTTRGVSNVFTMSSASLTVKKGILIAVFDKRNSH